MSRWLWFWVATACLHVVRAWRPHVDLGLWQTRHHNPVAHVGEATCSAQPVYTWQRCGLNPDPAPIPSQIRKAYLFLAVSLGCDTDDQAPP